MRDKSKWNKNAIFGDLLFRLGKKLVEDSMWEKYMFVRDTTSPGCELAEKILDLLFSKEEIKPILEELDRFYDKFKSIKKN